MFSEIVWKNRGRVPAAEDRVGGHSTTEDRQPRNSCRQVCCVFVAQSASGCRWELYVRNLHRSNNNNSKKWQLRRGATWRSPDVAPVVLAFNYEADNALAYEFSNSCNQWSLTSVFGQICTVQCAFAETAISEFCNNFHHVWSRSSYSFLTYNVLILASLLLAFVSNPRKLYYRGYIFKNIIILDLYPSPSPSSSSSSRKFVSRSLQGLSGAVQYNFSRIHN